MDSVEGLSADDIPCLLPTLPFPQPTLPKSAEESLDSVSELPNASQQLQHLVKGLSEKQQSNNDNLNIIFFINISSAITVNIIINLKSTSPFEITVFHRHISMIIDKLIFVL